MTAKTMRILGFALALSLCAQSTIDGNWWVEIDDDTALLKLRTSVSNLTPASRSYVIDIYIQGAVTSGELVVRRTITHELLDDSTVAKWGYVMVPLHFSTLPAPPDPYTAISKVRILVQAGPLEITRHAGR